MINPEFNQFKIFDRRIDSLYCLPQTENPKNTALFGSIVEWVFAIDVSNWFYCWQKCYSDFELQGVSEAVLKSKTYQTITSRLQVLCSFVLIRFVELITAIKIWNYLIWKKYSTWYPKAVRNKPVLVVIRRDRFRWMGQFWEKTWTTGWKLRSVMDSRPRGRPRKTWNNVVQEDMRLRGLGKKDVDDRNDCPGACKVNLCFCWENGLKTPVVVIVYSVSLSGMLIFVVLWVYASTWNNLPTNLRDRNICRGQLATG